ncbi:MAG: HPr family phosphocarrier protein [Acidobacteria bacterium]|nr:HPr family phosphocarrier protein [Acidobacteriota bacterium]
MIERSLEITNKKGLHARAAAKLINLTHNFQSDVYISKGDNEVNGKSILGLLMLAAHQGTWVTVKVEGNDEDTALESICELINGKFQENE